MELSGKAVAFTVSVAIAVITRSYWAIAAATVCGPLVSTLLSYYIAPLRPRLTLVHWANFSSLIGWNFLSQLSAALNWQIDRLMLPRLTTDTVFGQYAMGKQMSEIPIQALVAPLARPAMAALASAGGSQASRYLQLSHAIALVLIPVMGVPLFWPDVLVRVALGPAWVLAAEWVRWLSAVALIGLPAVLMGSLAMTLNRTRWVAVRTLVELLARLPLVWAGAVHFGIPGAIAGSAIATATGTLTALFIVRRLIGTGLAQQVFALWRPIVSMLPAGAVLWLARPRVMGAASLTEMAISAVLVGALYLLAYALSVLGVWRLAGRPAGLERHLVDTLRNRFKQSTNAMESHGTQPQ